MVNIEENVPLKPMTTFKVGGPARYFARVSSVEELHEAVKFARDKKLPIFVLGGGSNLIASDRGFNGLVIKPDFRKIEVSGETITCGAGVPFGALVNAAIKNNLGGLEWAAGIPGTVGGAVRGNAGAFGSEMKDVVAEVISIDPQTDKLTKKVNKQCQFEYRGSIFKHGNEIVIEAKLQLKKGDKNQIEQAAREHIQYRQQRHPHEHPSAGSVFKNVPSGEVPEKHKKQFADSVKTDPFPVVPAAKIIAEAGLSGHQIGGAQVSSKHTNYIINAGDATADDIIKLIEFVQKTVRDKFGIALQPEQQIIGS